MEGKDGRTERATPKRRDEQRRKGNLCISQEVTTAFVLVLSLLALRWRMPAIGDQLLALFSHVSRVSISETWNVSMVRQWFLAGLGFLSVLMAPVFILAFVGTVAANVMQTGFYYSTETLSLKFGELNPVHGFKRLFSVQSVFELVLSLLKVGLIVFVLYLLLRKRVIELLSLPALTPGMAVAWTFGLMFRMSMTVVVLFVVLAIADWYFKKRKYERGMMMTKKEVEEERKNQEPSPVVRGALRRKMRELTMSRMMAAVPKARVVITNPTHVAVALEYDPETMSAPKVVAKGLRLVAERIKAIAAEHNVPILERPEIARDLYKHVKVGKDVPSRLYGAVAEILAYLYRLDPGRIREVVRHKTANVEI